MITLTVFPRIWVHKDERHKNNPTGDGKRERFCMQHLNLQQVYEGFQEVQQGAPSQPPS